MILQQGLAKPLHPDQMIVIFCAVSHIFLLSAFDYFMISKKIPLSTNFSFISFAALLKDFTPNDNEQK
jgi:hypothetical protein